MVKSRIRYVNNLLSEDISKLREESIKEGFNIISRLINDYKSGKNKFNQKGEALIVCEIDDKIVGICGLNIDPINTKRARIRRLYVLPQFRNKKIGKKLVAELINYSINHFKTVSVNIGELNISKFYENLGFKEYDKEKGITHLLMHN